MMLKLLTAVVLLLGTARAVEPLRPLGGESPAAFQCRLAHVPQVRECARACEQSAHGDAGWDCVQACSARGRWAIAQCREQAAAASAEAGAEAAGASSVASR